MLETQVYHFKFCSKFRKIQIVVEGYIKHVIFAALFRSTDCLAKHL